LTLLDLWGKSLQPELASVLVNALKENSSLMSPNLEYSSLAKAPEIAKLMKLNHSLKSLHLRVNYLGREGATVIAEWLKVNSCLESLNIGGNSFGDEGVSAIAEALTANSSVKYLNFERNLINEEGACAIAEALKFNSSSLMSLNLGNNSLGKEGASKIAEMLKVNDSLMSLSLAANFLEIEGISAIVNALHMPVEDCPNWKDVYPDAEEEIPNNLTMSKGPKVRMTVNVDADHAHDLVTRRSITGILMMLNNTPIRWVSRCWKTVQTSTYGSELVASRITTELILEVRLMLRSLGVDLDGPTLMLGDNMSVVLNTSVPSSVLKKKNNAIAYHCVQEAIAAKVMRFAYIK
jgi:Leucine Rich repeat